jgi:RimJ/RimL family protein N-acetyltransferase
MELVPLDYDALIRIAARWLAEPENRRWLDLSGEDQRIGANRLRAMVQDDSHIIRAFTSDEDHLPIGLVALSGVNQDFRSAVLWAVLGDRKHAGRGYLLRASSAMLTLGFSEFGLECVNAWSLEGNQDSLQVLQELNFRAIGRQRDGQVVDGRPFDKLLFEIMAAEHRNDDARDSHLAG